MSDLKQCSHEARRAAATASALTQEDIDEYLRDRVAVDREQEALECSRNSASGNGSTAYVPYTKTAR